MNHEYFMNKNTLNKIFIIDLSPQPNYTFTPRNAAMHFHLIKLPEHILIFRQ